MATQRKIPAGYWERRAWLRGLEVSTAVKFVLLTLDEYAGNDEWAFPHQDTLAADVSLSERMVRRHLDWAISRGLLEVERTPRGNRYRIDFTWPGYNRKRYDPDPTASSLCAGLPTPHRGPTAGLPDSDPRSQLAEEETVGRGGVALLERSRKSWMCHCFVLEAVFSDDGNCSTALLRVRSSGTVFGGSV